MPGRNENLQILHHGKMWSSPPQLFDSSWILDDDIAGRAERERHSSSVPSARHSCVLFCGSSSQPPFCFLECLSPATEGLKTIAGSSSFTRGDIYCLYVPVLESDSFFSVLTFGTSLPRRRTQQLGLLD